VPGIRAPARRAWLITARGEAFVTALLAIPGAVWLLRDKVVAGPAFNAVKRFVETPSADQEAAKVGLEQIKSVGSGITAPVLTVIGIVLLAVYKFWLGHHKDTETRNKEAPNQLAAALVGLMEGLKTKGRLSNASSDVVRFRATLHRIEAHEHVQHLPYVGLGATDPDRLPGPHRRWPNAVGLVGQVARIQATAGDGLHMRMDDSVRTLEEFVAAMVRMYGYNDKQAKDHAPMRLASLAIPIRDGDPGNVIGVLYCDSSERDFFDDEVKELCATCAQTMASLVKLSG